MSKKKKVVILLLSMIIVLLVLLLLSLYIGTATISLQDIRDSFFRFDETNTLHLLVREMRFPRTIAAVVIGAALAVSGAIMQGVTRNPMADSGLMGLSAGASFMIAICISLLQINSYILMLGFSFLGTFLGATIVHLISALIPGSNMSMKLVLSGAMLSTFLVSFSQAIAIQNGQTQSLMFWTLGSISGISWNQLLWVSPFMIIGFVMAIVLAKKISILYLADEVAKGLGIKVTKTKVLATIAVVVLSGTSFALAGNIMFVGILIAHFCRYIVGSEYRYSIPLCMVFGGVLVLLSDMLARGLNPPIEYPVGAIISIVGVPVFLYFARKGRKQV